MDHDAHWGIVERVIVQAMDTLFPYGAGNTTHHRVGHHLEAVARAAFREGQAYALTSLMTVEDVAAHFGITPRRVRAIARNRQTRFADLGWQVPGTNQWLFRPEELEQLQPDERYRRKDA